MNEGGRIKAEPNGEGEERESWFGDQAQSKASDDPVKALGRATGMLIRHSTAIFFIVTKTRNV